MKIVLIIYAVSWLILLVVYISSLFSKNKLSSSDKTPWYVHVVMYIFAPLAIIMMPYFLYTHYKDKKKAKERKKELRELENKKNEVEYGIKLSKESQIDYVSVARTLHDLVRTHQYNKFLNCLDKITLPNGAELIVEECGLDNSRIGKTSKLLIQLSNGEKDKNIFNHLIVEDSAMGAWQAYLLHELWHVLPRTWHANYHARYYIFTPDDIDLIGVFEKDRRSFIIEQLSKFNFPSGVWKKDGLFYVLSCYWNNSDGLIRECLTVSINDNKVSGFQKFHNKTEYEYDCGIIF